MAEKTFVFPDGASIKEWDTLVSAGLNDQQLRILKHSLQGRLLIFGQAGEITRCEGLEKPTRGDIEARLIQICSGLDLPAELAYSCMRRLPEWTGS